MIVRKSLTALAILVGTLALTLSVIAANADAKSAPRCHAIVNGKKSWSTKFCPKAGKQGERGLQGQRGEQGTQGSNGLQGTPGTAGAAGRDGMIGATGAAGADGKQGVKGDTGATGASAFDIWRNRGGKGDEESFLDSLIGARGPQGDVGPQGPQGEQGPVGPVGPAGPQGNDGLLGAFYAVAKYKNANAGAIATVACDADPSKTNYTAIAGGVQMTGTGADNSNNTPVSSSFPGRMDWSVNKPKANRLDGWIVQFGGNAGPVSDRAPMTVNVWALCVPKTNIPVVTTYSE